MGSGTADRGSPGMKITALAAGFVMASVDATVMQIAGATVQRRLHGTLSQLTWAVDGYVLMFAALLMLAGGLAGRAGARTVYQWGMAVFFLASLASALAPTIETLIAARLAQGVGAALFMPSSLALLVHAFPDSRDRTRAVGLWSAVVSSAIALGPTVGGVMVDAFGWRSIFLINLPLGLAGMALTRRYIAAVPGRRAPLAVSGHAALVLGLAALSFALIEGPHRGWGSGPVLVSIALALAVAALLPFRERRARTTVMPWGLFREPRFAGANAIGFLFNGALYGTLFLVGLYFQRAGGAGPLRAGLQILPLTLFIPLSNIVFTRLSARVANGPLLVTALLAAAAAAPALAFAAPGGAYWPTAVLLAASGIAGGITSPAMTAALVDSAGPRHGDVAGSVLNANRQIGTLVGIAVVGAVLGGIHDWTIGVRVAFLLIGAAYLAGALAAWRLISRPERAAPAPSTPHPATREDVKNPARP
ncbi:MFS transporter [Actinomadura roseirufa]|uniref:MFS transporter n=1 Tax=Actinomadura roseirufa TaxID=2094049 RepID=UPI0010413E05|nr:MFS transporter [Actinomadura roseirufa]